MVTDNQVRRLFRLSKTERNQEIAVAKAGMDVKTARKYRTAGKLPSELRKERNWRTRQDPFAEVWEHIREQIQASPGLEAKTLFEALQREQPGALPRASCGHCSGGSRYGGRRMVQRRKCSSASSTSRGGCAPPTSRT